MIRTSLEELVNGKSLTLDSASAVMEEIMEGQATPAQLGAFLTALRSKGESAEEIAGMATVMRAKSLKVNVEGQLVDSCGTGGDNRGTFNISTAAAFVAAAGGVRMAKHGNRSASSACGSADVLEALGVKIELGPCEVRECIEDIGIGFMFAPIFHPAMKYAAPVRRELGIRTIFNILGPLTNPANARHQLLGVSDSTIGYKMVEALQKMGSRHSWVVHGRDGLDELTLGELTDVWELRDNQIRSFTIDPTHLGLPRADIKEIKGGSPEDNAIIIRNILSSETGAPRNIVLLNSAAIFMVNGNTKDIREAIKLSSEIIDSGDALKKLEALIKKTNGFKYDS